MFSRTQSASLPRRAPLDQRTWTAPEKQRRLAPMDHQRPTPQALPEPRRRSGALEALPGRGAARVPPRPAKRSVTPAPPRTALRGRSSVLAPSAQTLSYSIHGARTSSGCQTRCRCELLRVDGAQRKPLSSSLRRTSRRCCRTAARRASTKPSSER